ncbi:hypothetical protein [Paenibacillus sp. S150]|uniref:hypothetical protein n=1 Tax=Paenibacillus sp. S150 TaxID=2749826 RepID=UPI001C598666|nr:hypothetical protein [Paenibacillus sp. S150]MBW4083881.1 hypothetical protein [Paenibacillus sp. S150]
MGVVDILLLFAYSISFVCTLLLIAALFLYFRRRFRAKVVSLFMLSAFFFLDAYTVQLAVAIWIRFSSVCGTDTLLASLELPAWAIAQTGTAFGLIILTLLMYTKRQDLFIVLSGSKKGETNADPNPNQK